MGYDDDHDNDDWFPADDDGWAGYDDDRRAAYRRALSDFIYDDFVLADDNDFDDDAGTDRDTFIEFANIVQQYDDTATGTHDDIDGDVPSDDTEYDANGDPVIAYGIIISVIDAIEEFGSFADIPDDYEFRVAPPVIPDSFNRHKFPLHNPFKPACKRRRAFRIDGRYPDNPPV